MLLLAALLAAQPAPAEAAAPAAPADIELNVRATVREVRIRQRGEASVRVHAAPDGGSRSEAPRAAGAREMRGRNVQVDVHAAARIADPAANVAAPETSSPN